MKTKDLRGAARRAAEATAGLTDLRRGLSGPRHSPLPLPAGPRCRAVAATLGEGQDALEGRLFGDALVPVGSALGRHRDRARTLAFAADRQCVLPQTGHLDLLDSPAVAGLLRQWLAPVTAPATTGG